MNECYYKYQIFAHCDFSRNLVDDWMEHYRIAVGISSPHIRNMKETPYHRRRNIHSAMPGTRGGRTAAALLSGESDEERNEDLALSYDRAAARKILQRAPSAPPGQYIFIK